MMGSAHASAVGPRAISKLAKWSYSLAVVLIPVSVASKFLLGLEGITWIDPTLLLALIAGLALLPHWGDFLSPPLRVVTVGAAALAGFSVSSALSGFMLWPTADLYAVVREPVRLTMVLGWLVISAWFFLHKPRLTLKCASMATFMGLASGAYMYLAALGLAPVPPSVRLYLRLYLLRQSVWFHGFPIPRMGGLYIEAPPFGLFMFSMLVVFAMAWSTGIRSTWVRRAALLALTGLCLSLATQVLLGLCVVGALLSLPFARRRPLLGWPIVASVLVMLCSFALIAEHDRMVGQGELTSVSINGNSLGERVFHMRYAAVLLAQQPAAAMLGIGPGRYGDYAADSGLYPGSVTMQSSGPELLVEWGSIGLAAWIVFFTMLMAHLWRQPGVSPLAWALGLIVADSFQANWKAEGAALAVAALCALPLCRSSVEKKERPVPVATSNRYASGPSL